MHNFSATKNKIQRLPLSWGTMPCFYYFLIFLLLLIRVEYKEVEQWDKAGTQREDEPFTELIPRFISAFRFPTDFQQ